MDKPSVGSFAPGILFSIKKKQITDMVYLHVSQQHYAGQKKANLRRLHIYKFTNITFLECQITVLKNLSVDVHI